MKSLLLVLAACASVSASGSDGPSSCRFDQTALWPGYDGKFCKISPSVVSDGRGLAFMMYTKWLVGSSDVFYGQLVSRSEDGGRTWSKPVEVDALADTHEFGLRTVRMASPYFSAKGSRWFGLGLKEYFKDDSRPIRTCIDGRPYLVPLFLDFDPKTAAFSGCREIDFPIRNEGCYPFGQIVEEANGDLLIPYHFHLPGAGRRSSVVVLRQALDASGLKVVRVGRVLSDETLKRGWGEPSLVRFKGRYYLTLRSNEYGAFAESEDGLVYSAPRKWAWEDGSPIGNANTQQHWVSVGDRLFLAYTRVTPTNGHVFRNRAPIFVAEFDPARGCLLRATERVAVPERGARLGNFCVAPGANGESWLAVAEVMSPEGCSSRGSDNSIWFVRFYPH